MIVNYLVLQEIEVHFYLRVVDFVVMRLKSQVYLDLDLEFSSATCMWLRWSSSLSLRCKCKRIVIISRQEVELG